jgi:hypothetical protein
MHCDDLFTVGVACLLMLIRPAGEFASDSGGTTRYFKILNLDILNYE